jgi:probable rRNA maturation factor
MIESDTDKPPSPAGHGQLSIEVLDSTRRLPAGQAAWLRDHLERALESMESSGEVRVRIVQDDEMARAHSRYKGESGTTDVLTFDLSDAAGVLDTDILICIDVAERQAAARGHSAVQELLLYSIHGVLHCLGYDDHDEQEAARMHRAEDEVLERLGVGVTYARPERDEPKETR